MTALGMVSRRSTVVTWLAGGCMAALILLPVLIRPGWPFNHDWLTDVSRMSAIVGQWRLGHLVPVWSTTEQWGYGSPAPALYNKAFLYVSAAFLLTTHNPKASLCLALGFFMTIAFCGSAAAVRSALGRPHPGAELTAGALTVSCNYAATDWFVRGAFSEFAALAVAPWVFAWCLTLLARGRWRLWIGPAMAALVLSHVAIGLFSLLPLGLALLLALAKWRRRAVQWIRPAAGSIAIAIVLILPFELPMVALAGWAHVDALLAPVYTPRGSHLPPSRLFWDTTWHWGERWDAFTIQLDLLPLLGLVALLLVVTLQRRPAPVRAVTGFLVAVVALLLLLQTRLALPLYDIVPGAEYIQFSWRLLTFVSIALAIGAGLLVAQISGLWPGWRGVATGTLLGLALVASTAPNKPWWSAVRYSWFSAADVTAAEQGDVVGSGEYLPRVTAPATMRLLRAPVFDAGGPCTLVPQGDAGSERATMVLHATCPAAAQAALPVFDVPGLSAWAGTGGDMTAIAISRTCEDPRAHVALAPGETIVTLRFPTWSSLLAGGLRVDNFAYRRACPSQGS